MKPCRKCGKVIPCTIKIEGKTRNICNRKFCLECSPWGSRNTKVDDPARPSITNHNREAYANLPQEVKSRRIATMYTRGQDRKQRLVNILGGCCKKCGYNKCMEALDFHHRDPVAKLFTLSLNNLWSKPWEVLLTEADKCDVVCANCHRELHSKKFKNVVDSPIRTDTVGDVESD